MRRVWAAGFVMACGLMLVAAGPAPAPVDGPAGKVLVIGTKSVPPFAMRGKDGRWSGLSIELWRRVASQLGLQSRFVGESLPALIADTASGKIDGAIGAITVTAAREKTIDFTQPYFMTGLGIATSRRGESGLLSLMRAIFSLGFVQAVLGLVGLLMAVGLLVWLTERRHNDQFGGGVLRGLGNGLWWSAVTMTTVGYGDKAPTTLAGRFIAMGWMFASVIIISGVTAGITTALTTARIKGVVSGPNDLAAVRVGSIGGTTSADWLDGQQIVFTAYATAPAGLAAVKAGSIDAFVYDRPLLLYDVKQSYAKSLQVLPATFDRQN